MNCETMFKCSGCGEKYPDHMESINSLYYCKWCNEDEGYEHE